MAGTIKPPKNAFMRQLMRTEGTDSLYKFSDATGMPYAQAVRYAAIEDEHQVIESLYRDALLAGCESLDEFVLGLLPKLHKVKAEIEQRRQQKKKAV